MTAEQIQQIKGDKTMNEWKLFKDELPKQKKHVLVKEICSDEYMKEYECEEWERNIYSVLFIDDDNMVRGGDMFGGFSYPVEEIHKLDNYYWKYIEE